MNTDKLRILVVDDEIHARRGMRALLESIEETEVVGEAVDGTEAVDAIRRLQPDLVLLDIEMPDQNGLDVVREIGPDDMPFVIFVTAYDAYAVEAFEANAIDYLLKPVTAERFRSAIRRVRDGRQQSSDKLLGERLHALLAERDDTVSVEHFTVRTGNALKVFHVDDIDWIEADDYYTRLHIDGNVHLSRQTMTALEQQLPAGRFLRIHRSTIVNLNRIVRLEPLFQGDYTVVLKDDTQLRMSRRRREVLQEVLKNFT